MAVLAQRINFAGDEMRASKLTVPWRLCSSSRAKVVLTPSSGGKSGAPCCLNCWLASFVSSRNFADVTAFHSGGLKDIAVTLIEGIKETIEKVTGWAQPSGEELD